VGVARGGVACAITLTLTLTLGDVITNPEPNPSRSRNPNPRQWAWPKRWAWPNMQMSCQSRNEALWLAGVPVPGITFYWQCYYRRLIEIRMRSMEWCYFQWPWVTHKLTTPNISFSTFASPFLCSALICLMDGDRDFEFATQVVRTKSHAPMDDKPPLKGA